MKKQRQRQRRQPLKRKLTHCLKQQQQLTFTREVGTEPLRRGVVEEALGVREADGEVAWVARVLQHSLQRELSSVCWAVVRPVLDTWRVGTVN